jgi:hypothetical protein
LIPIFYWFFKQIKSLGTYLSALQK